MSNLDKLLKLNLKKKSDLLLRDMLEVNGQVIISASRLVDSAFSFQEKGLVSVIRKDYSNDYIVRLIS